MKVEVYEALNDSYNLADYDETVKIIIGKISKRISVGVKLEK